MRPAGEVRQALLQACATLAVPGQAQGHEYGQAQGVTLREMAHHAQVGVDAARLTIKNMRRAGEICIVGERLVAYRNKPVAVYQPVARVAAAGSGLPGLPGRGCMNLANVLRVWAG